MQEVPASPIPPGGSARKAGLLLHQAARDEEALLCFNLSEDLVLTMLPLMGGYSEAVQECRHPVTFHVVDEPVMVWVCWGCGEVFTDASGVGERELARPFVEALS